MKVFIPFLILVSLSSYAQKSEKNEPLDFYSETGRRENIEYLEKNILEGCQVPKAKQPPFLDASYKVNLLKLNFYERFSESLNDNPKLKESFWKDLEAIESDPSCKSEGNTCRTKLYAVSIYYIQNLRPKVPGCDGYKSQMLNSSEYKSICEAELKLKKQPLNRSKVDRYHWGQLDKYTAELNFQFENLMQQLTRALVYTTTKQVPSSKLQIEKKNLQNIEKIIQEAKQGTNPDDLTFCGNVDHGIGFEQPFVLEINPDYLMSAEIRADKPKKVVIEEVKECFEEKEFHHYKIVPTPFNEGELSASTPSDESLGKEAEPVKDLINGLFLEHPNLTISEILVESSSSKTPFYIKSGEAWIIDPKSHDRNANLAQKRADQAEVLLTKFKSTNPVISNVTIKVSAGVNGPEFTNDKKYLKSIKSKDLTYKEKARNYFSLYHSNKTENEVKFIEKFEELMDTSKYQDLYQAKYKPYQGFRVTVHGYTKEKVKCEETKTPVSNKPSNGAAKDQ